jgi:magnesium chelatase family protein
MLARTVAYLLPPLSAQEAIEVIEVHSAANSMIGEQRPIQRPFREPHHSVSIAGFTGREEGMLPGELALAHCGVLFLDEFPEFPRHVIESLREPMETGSYQVSRAWGEVRYPADFMLVATMNPCPCGFLNDEHEQCRCSAAQILRYRGKISGPILDRIDLHVILSRSQPTTKQVDQRENFATIANKTIKTAAKRQRCRFSSSHRTFNGQMGVAAINEFCRLSTDNEQWLLDCVARLKLSHRGYHSVLRVARTLADLSDSDAIERPHILEALQFRALPPTFL